MAPRLAKFSMLLVWLAMAGEAAAASGSARTGQPHQETTAAPAGPQGAACTTPRGQSGRCITLQTCKPLLDLLKTTRFGPRGLPDAEVTLLLRMSYCGFQGRSVMVCCPVDASNSHVKPEQLGHGSERPLGSVGPANSELGYPARPSSTRPTFSTSRPQTPAGAGYQPSGSSGVGFSTGDPDYGNSPQILSGNLPEPESYPAPAAASPDRQDDVENSYPTENLALLPIEVCGMAFGQKQVPVGNRSALMQFPWMARLGYRQGVRGAIEYLCTGSLISERYVLTSAHCIGYFNGPVTVRLGDWDAATDPDCVETVCAPAAVDVAVEDRVVHEGHHRGVHDIALLRLSRPVAFSEAVNPICLPMPTRNRPQEELTGKTMVVAGWGTTSPVRRQSAPSRLLLKYRLQTVGPSACHDAYDALDDVSFDPDKHICAGGGCRGDCGSPLMLSEASAERGDEDGDGSSGAHERRAVLHGVLAYGAPDCALRSAPLVFTNVSRYMPWLLRNLKPNPFVPKDRSSGSGLVDPRGAATPAATAATRRL